MFQDLLENWLEKAGSALKIDARYFFSSGITMAAGGAAAALVLLSTNVLLARLLSQEQFGLYQFFISVLGVAAVTALPGLHSIILSWTAKGDSRPFHEASPLAVRFSLFGSVAILFLAGYYYLQDKLILALASLIAAAGLPFLYGFSFWDSYLQGKQRFRRYQFYRLLQMVVSFTAIVVVLHFWQDSFVTAFTTFVVSNAASHMLITWHEKRRARINSSTSGEWKEYGYFLTAMSAISVVLANVDNLIVGYFFGVNELAVYAVGSRLALQLKDFLKMTLGVTLPKIATRNTFSLRLHLMILLMGFAAVAPLMLLLPHIIPFLYTQTYANSVVIAQVILAFIPFALVYLVASSHFTLLKYDKKAILIERSARDSLRLILLCIFSWRWGIIGIAVAVGLQYIVSLIVLYAYAWRGRLTTAPTG